MSVLSDIVAKFRKGSPNIAAAFDEVERRLVALEGDEPPPPPPPPAGSVGTAAGYLKLGSSELPPSNRDSYELVALGGSGFPNTLTKRAIRYVSGTNVPQSWSAGVPYNEAAANGWLLRDAQGNLIGNRGYPGHYLGDVGSTAYQQAWCRNVESYCRAEGSDGFYSDDTINFGAMWWTAVPAKYPNAQAWDDAMISFCRAVGDYFRPKGLYVAHNAHAWNPNDDPESNNGMRKARWFARIAPHTDGLMCESWLKVDGHGVRRTGSEWWNNWDGYRNLHRLCNGEQITVSGGTLQIARPIDFIGLDYGTSSERLPQRYCYATLLLDVQPGSVFMWNTTDNTDPWTADYGRLGEPVAAATKSGNVWTRVFQNGRVTVDPVAGTATIV